MANSLLPQEILVEIFSRLPSKSVGKCKCLSKSWRSLLSTPQFINLCLAHHGNLILINPSHSLHLVTPTIDNDAVSRKLELPNSWTEVVGSCKGLVLLANKEGELYLVNPITTLMVNIPDSDLALKKGESTRTHGFGYDSSSNDYKIVTLSYYNRGYGSGCRDTFVDVYSVKTGVWKRVNFPYNGFAPELENGAFVNGAIHWQAYGTAFHSPCIIAAFDLANEIFYEIPAPFILNSTYKSLLVRGGRLCVVSQYCRRGGDIWTMEEYGWVQTWNKFIIPENEDWVEAKPLCFVGEEGVVLTTEEGSLFVYYVKEQMMKEFVVDGVPAYCKDAGNFVSLG